MRIYRVEHSVTGKGPYVDHQDDVLGLHAAHEGSKSHPGPWEEGEDFGWQRYSWHKFGFPSRAKCDEWFENFDLRLRTAGYVVKVYEVGSDDVILSPSGKQVMFVHKNAEVVDTQSTIGYRKYYQTN
jgi:hypothetical protein